LRAAAVSPLHILGGLLVVALFVYLVIALLAPEKLQ
jgi:K+-transporting ATPase KdpF subunit